MQPTSQMKPRRHAGTASRVFSGEAVVITPAESLVRMFNPTGSRIWELADGEHSLAQIAAILAREFDVDEVEALDSVQAFVSELVGKELLTLEA